MAYTTSRTIIVLMLQVLWVTQSKFHFKSNWVGSIDTTVENNENHFKTIKNSFTWSCVPYITWKTHLLNETFAENLDPTSP